MVDSQVALVVDSFGPPFVQHECFSILICDSELQTNLNHALFIVLDEWDALGPWVIMCYWFIKTHGSHLFCTWTIWRAGTSATTHVDITTTIRKTNYTSFIIISWARKESQLLVWWGWGWPCKITLQCFFQEVVSNHEFCECQWFILIIKGSDIMFHIPIG